MPNVLLDRSECIGFVRLVPDGLVGYIDHAASRCYVTDYNGERIVALTASTIMRFARSQAYKSPSNRTCTRLCIAAFYHPRLVGAEVIHA